VVICWTLKMYSGVLCSFGPDLTYCHHTLLHCNASNFAFDILNKKAVLSQR